VVISPARDKAECRLDAAERLAAWPTTVTRSRCPRAFALKNAEAVLGVVEGDPLNEARENFLSR
jgi:hypothetical protein